MKPLEIDLNKIKQIGIKKEDENFRFRSFLKQQDGNRVDKIVHRINSEVEVNIDCTRCGNCCGVLQPSVKHHEIDRLAVNESISRDEFINKYTEQDNFDKTYYLKVLPCRYLTGKKCSIYPSRPDDCKSFPHIHKKGFSSRTLIMIEYYGICPIVFNAMERLKMELRFR